MRRLILLFAFVAAVAVGAAIAWRWWTAPPREDAGTLASALAATPSEADGALALAQPARATRWLASHPQALVLLRLAAPVAERSLPRLRGFLLVLAAESRGPVAIWWRGSALAVGAEVEEGAVRTLERLAALEALPFRKAAAHARTFTVAAASDPELLSAARGRTSADVGSGSLTALVRCGGRWWRARAGRSTLDLVTGEPTDLPEAAGPGTIVTPDLAALLAAVASAEWMASAPARLLFDGGGWAVELPATTVPREVRILLSLGGDAAAEAPAGARRWRGVLGELWVLPGPGFAAASRPDLLASLPRGAIEGESGRVRGEDLARAVDRVARAAEGIPGGVPLAGRLRQAAPVLEGVRLARWRLRPQGGRILLQW